MFTIQKKVLEERKVKLRIFRQSDGSYINKWYLKNTNELHRDDGPAVYDDKKLYEIWYRLGKQHREDGPACRDQSIEIWKWWGNTHREDGPAVIYLNGGVEWWWKNKQFLSIDDWGKKAKLEPDEISYLKMVYL